MSYPNRYCQMQNEVMSAVRLSHLTGLCPVCKVRPSSVWPSGVQRITCGQPACFLRWLPVHGQQAQPQPAPAQPPVVAIEPPPVPSHGASRLPQSERSALGRLWLHVGAHWFLPATTISDEAGRHWIAANVGVLFEEMAPGYLVRFRPAIASKLSSIHTSRTFYRRSKAEIDQMWLDLLNTISNL